jgi:hypothetical protein
MKRPRTYRRSCAAVLYWEDGRMEEMGEFPGVPRYMNAASPAGFIRFELARLSGNIAFYRQIAGRSREAEAPIAEGDPRDA